MERNPKSEIARLRARIEAENEAARFALTAPALGTAKHWFITRRMERISDCQDELTTHIGPRAAAAIVGAVMNGSLSGGDPPANRTRG